MKCAYSNCDLGGNVDKDVAIKENGKYYHEQCSEKKHIKKEIEQYYFEHINPNDPIKNVRVGLSNYIDKKKYDPKYVLWCVKNKSQKVNNMFGLAYVLAYKQNEIEYNKIKVSETKITFDKYETDDFMQIETIKPKPSKKWEDSWLK